MIMRRDELYMNRTGENKHQIGDFPQPQQKYAGTGKNVHQIII